MGVTPDVLPSAADMVANAKKLHRISVEMENRKKEVKSAIMHNSHEKRDAEPTHIVFGARSGSSVSYCDLDIQGG